MHGEGERGKRIYVAVTCTRTQMLSRTLALDLGLTVTLPAHVQPCTTLYDRGIG